VKILIGYIADLSAEIFTWNVFLDSGRFPPPLENENGHFFDNTRPRRRRFPDLEQCQRLISESRSRQINQEVLTWIP
jgi:hypothetical protein